VQKQNMYHVTKNPFFSQLIQTITTQLPTSNSYCNCSN